MSPGAFFRGPQEHAAIPILGDKEGICSRNSTYGDIFGEFKAQCCDMCLSFDIYPPRKD